MPWLKTEAPYRGLPRSDSLSLYKVLNAFKTNRHIIIFQKQHSHVTEESPLAMAIDDGKLPVVFILFYTIEYEYYASISISSQVLCANHS